MLQAMPQHKHLMLALRRFNVSLLGIQEHQIQIPPVRVLKDVVIDKLQKLFQAKRAVLANPSFSERSGVALAWRKDLSNVVSSFTPLRGKGRALGVILSDSEGRQWLVLWCTFPMIRLHNRNSGLASHKKGRGLPSTVHTPRSGAETRRTWADSVRGAEMAERQAQFQGAGSESLRGLLLAAPSIMDLGESGTESSYSSLPGVLSLADIVDTTIPPSHNAEPPAAASLVRMTAAWSAPSQPR